MSWNGQESLKETERIGWYVNFRTSDVVGKCFGNWSFDIWQIATGLTLCLQRMFHTFFWCSACWKINDLTWINENWWSYWDQWKLMNLNQWMILDPRPKLGDLTWIIVGVLRTHTYWTPYRMVRQERRDRPRLSSPAASSLSAVSAPRRAAPNLAQGGMVT